MPFEAKEGIDILAGGGIIGGIVAFVTSIGWYIRKEKSDSAKNRTDIAMSDAVTRNVVSQSEEIEILRKRISDQDAVILNLQAEIFKMKRRLVKLETGREIASIHLKALNLCDGCTEANKHALDAINRALDNAVDESE
jgi:uncharacterized protein (DUF342 family)